MQLKRKKPVVVFVFGILNIVFGGLSMVIGLCCGLGLLFVYIGVRALYQQIPPQDKEELDQLWAAVASNIPGLVPVLIGSVVASLVLAILQIVGGIGLVKVQDWARRLSAFWAVLQIFSLFGFMYYQLAYQYPGFQKAQEDLNNWAKRLEQRQRQPGQPPPPRQNLNMFGAGTGNPIVDNLFEIGFNVCKIAYAAAVFIIMLLPGTAQAMARYRGEDAGFSPEQQDDSFDEDYLRRRRQLDQPPEEPRPPGY
jgi:hypothetical protein